MNRPPATPSAPLDAPTRTIAVGVVARLDVQPPVVLISRRREGTVLGGYWEFPGGKVEPGESVEDALHRELREELDVDVEPTRALGVVEHAYPHGRVRLEPHLCRLRDGSSPPRALQVAEFRWVTREDLSAYRFPEANDALLAEVVALMADASWFA